MSSPDKAPVWTDPGWAAAPAVAARPKVLDEVLDRTGGFRAHPERVNRATGLNVLPDPNLLDGTVFGFKQWVVVGTRAWDVHDWARECGRRIARNGLAEWVAYIGEKVGPAVDDPYPAVTGRQFMDVLKSGAL